MRGPVPNVSSPAGTRHPGWGGTRRGKRMYGDYHVQFQVTATFNPHSEIPTCISFPTSHVFGSISQLSFLFVVVST